MVFLAGDRDRVVVSERPLAVPGGTLRRRGPVPLTWAARGDRIGLHGSALRAHLAAIGLAAVATTLATALAGGLVARMAGIALVAVTLRAALVYRRTNRTAARLHDGAYALTGVTERADLERALSLVDQIWDNRRRLPALAGTDDAAPLLNRAIGELCAALRRREQLAAIHTDLARRSTAGLPATSVAVQADREQRARAAALWDAVSQEVAGHLAALGAAADAGTGLLRELSLIEQTRRTAAALDAVDFPTAGPAGVEVATRTAAFAAACRELDRRYGAAVHA